MSKNKVVIIGGGLGGLFCGAILAKEGFNVTILEKNATIGGGLQSFQQFGETFDTGMHIIGGMQKGGNIYRICKYLGIIDNVKILDVDENCSEELYFAQNKQFYILKKGKQNFIDSLATYFPEEKDNLQAYVDKIFQMVENIDLFNLRESHNFMFSYTDNFLIPANEFINHYIKNKELRSVLAYMNPYYGGIGGKTPAYIHAIINVLYINGTSRFVGGSHKFADLLKEIIIGNDGEVKTNSKVQWIEVKNKNIEYVETINKERFSADYYISNIHPHSLLTLMEEKALPKSYRDRLLSIPNSYSAFLLAIKLKENTFPYINHSQFYMSNYNDIWSFADENKPWPMGFLFMTPPNDNQGKYASKVLITSPMTFSHVKRWENTQVGQRGDEYLNWKKECTDKLLQLIKEIHPDFISCIENINAASPLTIRDYYASSEGCISGFSKDVNNIILSQVPIVTKIKNLFLTGQNNNMHGFCGVALTAINTCEILLGNNYIIKKINQCEN